MILFATLLLSNITVTLPAEAHVQGSEITLGEIAQIEGADAAELSRLESFALGYAPSPGYSRVLQDWKILASITREFPELTFAVSGSKACRIWPTVSTVEGKSLSDAARRGLEGLLSGQDVEITLAGKIKDELVPTGTQSRDTRAQPSMTTVMNSANNTGIWSVPVQIIVDGDPYRSVWVPFEVTIFRTMPVLKRDLPVGSTIQVGDLVMKRTALRALTDGKSLSETQLVGATTRRHLAMNQPVLERDVERALAIKQGETISLHVSKGLIQVDTTVIALADAYIGDVIQVRVFGSGKELNAKVIGKGRVRLDLGK